MEVWVFALALAWLVSFVRGNTRFGPVIRKAWPLMACCCAWLILVWAQLLPIPIGLLQVLSPESARWHTAAALHESITWAPLTLDRYSTLEAALKSTAYVVFLALALVLMQGRERIRMASYVLIASGIFQALYGALMSFQATEGLASGTFVNRNHYAAYLVMCLSVGIGVLIASLSGSKSASWGHFFRGMAEWVITPKMGLRLLLVTMVIALVLTRSRMGNLSFMIALLSTGIMGLVLSKKATRSMVVLLVSLVLIDLLVVGTYFGTQRVIDRISETSLQGEDRDELAGYALAMWKDYPVLGSGLGSFAAVFPRYSGQGTVQSYTHAHNDYLEFAAETGIAGISLLGLIVLLSFLAALRAQKLRNDPVMRGISFASLMGITALMIHSAVDFSLQIPANALTFMQLLAFAWLSLHARNEAA